MLVIKHKPRVIVFYAGDNDLAVLKMIESCNTTVKPPSTFNPNVPKELDLIVLKILAKSPDKRFQTGEELSRALRRFVNTYAPEFSPADLAHVSKEVFGKEIVEDRKKILIGSVAAIGLVGAVALGYQLMNRGTVDATCVKDGSNEVVPDSYCAAGHSSGGGVFIFAGSPYRYYYGGSNTGVGSIAHGGTLTLPKGTTATTKSGTSISKGGSSVSRGGFGSSSHGSSGS